MSLIRVEHPVHLASAAEAEAFFRSLRLITAPRIGLSGFHTTDIKRIVRVVHAIDPRRTNTINFKAGDLGPGTRAALTRLAHMSFEFLSATTLGAQVRIWPTLYSRVHSDRRFPRAFGDAEVKVTPHGNDLETKAIDTAMFAFLDVAHEQITEGYVSQVAETAKPALLDFLRELQGTVHGHLEVDLARARSLTELYAGDPIDWHADGITAHFPEGTIEGFVTSPNTTEEYREKVRKRVDKALARAGIRRS